MKLGNYLCVRHPSPLPPTSVARLELLIPEAPESLASNISTSWGGLVGWPYLAPVWPMHVSLARRTETSDEKHELTHLSQSSSSPNLPCFASRCGLWGRLGGRPILIKGIGIHNRRIEQLLLVAVPCSRPAGLPCRNLNGNLTPKPVSVLIFTELVGCWCRPRSETNFKGLPNRCLAETSLRILFARRSVVEI